MKFIAIIFCFLVFSLNLFAQKPNDILATVEGRSYTTQDLPTKLETAWLGLPETLAKARKALLVRQINDVLFEVEAAQQKLTVRQLIDKEVTKKVPNPTKEQIKAVYEANKQALDNAPLSKVRSRIIRYLRQDPEKRAHTNYLATLRNKHAIVSAKDVNTPNLSPYEVLVSVGGKPITYSDFVKKNGLVLYEYKANIYDQVISAMKQNVDSTLYAFEAKKQGILVREYIEREITNKMVNYSDFEQARLQENLRKVLYKKYRVRFFVKPLKPFVQNISTDDDPFQGDVNAKVTVVMFSDFECPACASVHPILKKIISNYGNNVRFVVRDFPLTQIHEFALGAAVAANAAGKQGKYFEYIQLLYQNQNRLDLDSLIQYAAQVGLNVKKFEADLKNQKLLDEVLKDMEDGKKYSVNSTPTIFVNGIKVRTLSEDSFRNAIEKALSSR